MRIFRDTVCKQHEYQNIAPKKIHVSDGRYYRKSIEIIDTYKSIDTFDTRKKYR